VQRARSGGNAMRRARWQAPPATRPASSARPVPRVSVRGRLSKVPSQHGQPDSTGLRFKIFKLNSKNFEYQSCSTNQDLQLSLQALFHLRLRLKVRNSNLNSNKNTLYTLFFEFFSKFPVATGKTLNTKVVGHVKLYNFCFGQKCI
jgi:hypothetical protein